MGLSKNYVGIVLWFASGPCSLLNAKERTGTCRLIRMRQTLLNTKERTRTYRKPTNLPSSKILTMNYLDEPT